MRIPPQRFLRSQTGFLQALFDQGLPFYAVDDASLNFFTGN